MERKRPSEEQMMVEVSDTGAGMSESNLPHIFERFYRADKSTNRDSRGAGLGLSIAKWIVGVHRGVLEARSGSEGGITFVITLPGVQAS